MVKNKLNYFKFLYVKYRDFSANWFGDFDPEGFGFVLVLLIFMLVIFSLLLNIGLLINIDVLRFIEVETHLFCIPILVLIVGCLLTFFVIGMPSSRKNLVLEHFKSAIYKSWKGNLIAFLSLVIPLVISIYSAYLYRSFFHLS